jgi:hypothetical protein
MTTKAIKNISDDAWREFKTMASMRDMTLGSYFEELVHRARTESALPRRTFREILDDLEDNPLLSSESARIATTRIARFRKDFRMRT